MFEITEQEAVGEIAEIYKDIREKLDMPFVNTIWRNLATHGDALQWVWYSLKPIYASGAVAHYASELRSSLDISWILQMPDLKGSFQDKVRHGLPPACGRPRRVLDLEITPPIVYNSYEEACLEYSYLVNTHQAKNVLSDMLGTSTGSFNQDGEV